VLPLEVQRRGPSYTVETLRELARRYPRAEWFLLLEQDSLVDFPGWREAAPSLLATLAVAPRAGLGRAGRRGMRCEWLDAPPLAVSSSTLRRRIAAGASVRYLVPDAVGRYIARHGLYRKRR
jgi:nicotinate-nucleotide adenylyltransferase